MILKYWVAKRYHNEILLRRPLPIKINYENIKKSNLTTCLLPDGSYVECKISNKSKFQNWYVECNIKFVCRMPSFIQK
jgi:hypothetical protein